VFVLLRAAVPCRGLQGDCEGGVDGRALGVPLVALMLAAA